MAERGSTEPLVTREPVRLIADSFEAWAPADINPDLGGILMTSLLATMQKQYPEGIPESAADTPEKREMLLNYALVDALPNLALGLESVVRGDEMIAFMDFVAEKQALVTQAQAE